jgi:hypothetical protein
VILPPLEFPGKYYRERNIHIERAWARSITGMLPFSSQWDSPLQKCKQLFDFQNLLLLKTSGGQSYNLYLNVIHFFNTNVN